MFSVVMAVCYRDDPRELRQAILSLLEQTLAPGQIVMVEDGDVGVDLDLVVKEYEKEKAELFTVVRYEKNQGPAYAWNKGLEHSRYELVARMDSDDICRSDRFQKQYDFMLNHQEVDVLGGYINEFKNKTADFDDGRVRKVPLGHNQIFDALKKRNSINHVTVMFRKKAVFDSGSYFQINNHVDYYLWVRMAMKGYKFMNLDDVLVDVRASEEQLARRGGFRYISSEFKFYSMVARSGFISPFQAIVNFLVRLPFRVAPIGLRREMYKALRRG